MVVRVELPGKQSQKSDESHPLHALGIQLVAAEFTLNTTAPSSDLSRDLRRAPRRCCRRGRSGLLFNIQQHQRQPATSAKPGCRLQWQHSSYPAATNDPHRWYRFLSLRRSRKASIRRSEVGSARLAKSASRSPKARTPWQRSFDSGLQGRGGGREPPAKTSANAMTAIACMRWQSASAPL